MVGLIEPCYTITIWKLKRFRYIISY